MKVNEGTAGTPSKPTGNTHFREELRTKKRACHTKAARPVSTTVTASRAISMMGEVPKAKLVEARARMHQEAFRLISVRQQLHQVQEERLDSRLIDLICRELVSWLEWEGASRRQAANADHSASRPELARQVESMRSPGQASTSAQAERAYSAVALIEKIERLVKSQRPALSLTLGSGLAIRVEVERTGPRKVAIRIWGRTGPPPPEELNRLREEIRSRGLELSALWVG
jgi:hypothetical protein